MDFEAAYFLAREIEGKHPDVIVSGIRRLRPESPDSWGVDLMHRETQKLATVDEKDLADARIAEIGEE